MLFVASRSSDRSLVSSLTTTTIGFLLCLLLLSSACSRTEGFVSSTSPTGHSRLIELGMSTVSTLPSWVELQESSGQTAVGKALNEEVQLRTQGQGSPHVQNKLRLFQAKGSSPPITLFRDHAGWCPYCQKTMLLIEEKEIPMKIELVNMRSYGDKPSSFLNKVPNGLLPAIEVNGKIVTESSVIMELLDTWHPPSDGYKAMMPSNKQRYDALARLERELFSWWCQLLFRPEGGGGLGGMFQKTSSSGMSGAMQGFMECLENVDQELRQTPGPWFLGDDHPDHPTSIDCLFVSHVERMLASVAYWKGVNLRDTTKWPNLKGINAWLQAFEKKEYYLAFKSDYYTHIKDIPPQYGPGYNGGFEDDRQRFADTIVGKGDHWKLPLDFDDPVQPLYFGPPLPHCVLKATGIQADDDKGTYHKADPLLMAQAGRLMAAWKLSGNGEKVAQFAARGGPDGAKNMRKTFGAELADPYAESDETVAPFVDEALRVICTALLEQSNSNELPDEALQKQICQAVPSQHVKGVVSSLEYVRDRVGVPRDLPLASARYLRAYLNWGIDSLLGR